MVTTTKSTKDTSKHDTSKHDAVAEAPSSDVAATDERNWMLDLFDWPAMFGRGWRTGLPGRLFDAEHLFGDRIDTRFPMRVEQFRDGDDLVVRAELPGIDPDDDVEIEIEGRRLNIDATREDRTESTDDGHHSEFHYGRFHRSMSLPAGAVTDAVTATYTDGILEVRVPIRDENDTTKKVPISRS